MAQYVIRATATIPAGTPADAPVTLSLELDNFQIEAITLEVPPGPNGVMAFYLGNNGVPWLPNVPGEFFVWDDHSQTFYADNYPNASGWEVTGYNTGAYDHDVVVSFQVNAVSSPSLADTPLVLTFVETGVPDKPPVTL